MSEKTIEVTVCDAGHCNVQRELDPGEAQPEGIYIEKVKVISADGVEIIATDVYACKLAHVKTAIDDSIYIKFVTEGPEN